MALAREVLLSYLHFRDVPETPGGGAFECLGWKVDINKLTEQDPGEEFEGPRPRQDRCRADTVLRATGEEELIHPRDR